MNHRSFIAAGLSFLLVMIGGDGFQSNPPTSSGASALASRQPHHPVPSTAIPPELISTLSPTELQGIPITSVPAVRVSITDAGNGSRLTSLEVPAHGFAASWQEDGSMVLSPTASRQASGLRPLDEAGSTVSLKFARIGYGDEPEAVGAPEISMQKGRMEAQRAGITEWYQGAADGLEHGFTLSRAPGIRRGNSALEIALSVDTLLQPVGENHDSILFLDRSGESLWAYRKLVVHDDRGHRLPAWMELRTGRVEENEEILLCIADAGAQYPLTVDPTFSSTEVASFPVTSSEYGTANPPAFMDSIGDTVFFFANDGFIGNELWKTSRSTGETGLIKDIFPAGSGCFPTKPAVYKNQLYFGASDGSHGHQLWRSDGTTGNTVLFKDFSSTGGTRVDNAIVLGNYLYFNVLVTGSKYELWRTDGSAGGTQKMIPAGALQCDLREPVILGNAFIYSISDAGGQLWRSDGTAAGTFLLTGNAGWPRVLTVSGNQVFFIPQGSGEVWKTDGTVAGTARIAAATALLAGPPVAMGGFSYFSQTAGSGTVSLWRSNGGTPTLVRTVSTNPDSGMRMLAGVGDLVYFVYSNATDVSLWKSDGTSAGTVPLLSFGSPDFARITEPLAAGNTLFFSGTTQASGSELWRTDGTAAGTLMVKQIRPGNLDSYPFPRHVSENLLYFQAYDPVAGKELWRTDGTPEGTVMVRDIYPDELDKKPAGLVVVGGNLFFSAYAPGTGRELWKSDGTPAGTVLVKDVVPGSGSGFSDLNLEQWTAAGDLLFCMPQPLGGRSLLRSDGTADGTFTVKNIVTGNGPSGEQTHVVVPFKNYLLFPEGTSTTGGLWRSDGTVEGTFRLAGGGDGITVLGNLALFVAPDSNGVTTLWRTDGTPAGTSVVYPTRLTVGSPGLKPFKILNGYVYFSAADTSNGTELWKSNGTAAGTSMVANLTAGSGSSSIGVRAAVGSRIFFVKGTTTGGDELWSTDGTTAATVKLSTYTSRLVSFMPESGPQGGIFYFSPPGNANYELWGSNGTPAGTTLLKSFGIQSSVTGIFDMSYLNGRMIFTNSTSGIGDTLWSTNGAAAGTVPIMDLFPGTEASFPTIIGKARGFIFFAATDLTRGRELWGTDGTAAGTRLLEDLNPGPYSSGPNWVGEVNGRLLAAYGAFPATSTSGFREIHINPLPVPVTGTAGNLPGRGALLQGSLEPDGASGTAYFEYGPSPVYGQQTQGQPRNSTGPVSASVSGLSGGTVYHFRLAFLTPGGVFYGQDQTFETPVIQVFAGSGDTATELLNGQSAPLVLPDTPEGIAAQGSLTAQNASSLPVVLSSISLPAGYSLPVNPFPLTLQAGGRITFSITLLSPVPGVFTGQASIQSEAGAFAFPLRTTVLLVNDPPQMDSVVDRFTPEDTPIQGQFTATDPDLQSLTFSLAGPVTNGTAVVNANGSYVFTPAVDFHGTAFLTVKANDGITGSLPVTLTIYVLPVADPPTLALHPLLITPEDTAVSGSLSATSVEGGTLTYFNLSNPDPGTGSLTFFQNGTFTFVPAPDYSGATSFLAKASDGFMDSDSILVVVQVTPVNDPPVLSVVPSITIVEGLPVPGITVSVSDPDNSPDLLRLAAASDSAKMPASAISLSGAGTARMLTLFPPPGSAGEIVLTLELTDGLEVVTRRIAVTILENVIELARILPAGAQLRFTGIPGLNYQIQRSNDLGEWAVMTAVQAAANGAIEWTDPAAPPLKGYYRLSETRP